MNEISKLPVLILAYNRFEKFKRCINTLHKQGIKKIFLSIDGPKNSNDLINQKKIFNFCVNNSLDLEIKIQKLKHNYGCRQGPIKGISWFFSKNKYGVVLEDDVIISKKCIQAFSYLLNEYLENDKYMSISSFNEFSNNSVESVYSLPVWRSWGWASWSDRWSKHIEFSEKIKDLNIWELYKLMPEYLKSIETAKLVKASQLNLLDAWDYEFNFTHVVNSKRSLTLGGINTLVYGFDSTATHTIDEKSLGINFDLFDEREINFYQIMNNFEKNILILSKCGFQIRKNLSWSLKIYDFIKYLFYSLLFILRKIKRFIFGKIYKFKSI